MWDNLHKTQGMDVGQVGFHKQKAVKKIRLASRKNMIVNRLNKTKVIYCRFVVLDQYKIRCLIIYSRK